MTDDPSPSPDPKTPTWLTIAIAYRLWIGLLFSIFAIGAVVYFWINGVPEIEVPQWVRVAAVALLITVPLGALFSKPVVDWLYQPNDRFLVVLGVTDSAGLWRITPKGWADLEVTKGELHKIEEAQKPLYTATKFESDEWQAEGTWRGTLSDRDLLRSLAKVDECRGMLERDAKRGFAIETQSFTIIRSATREAVRSVVETFRRGSLPDQGDGIDDKIEDAIESYDLEKEIDRQINDDGEFSEDVEEMVDLDGVPDDADQEVPDD